MPWTTEAKFVEALVEGLPESELWLRRQGFRTVLMSELEGMHGRVDLVMASVPTRWSLGEERSRMLANRTCARVFVALRVRQPKSIAQLEVETGVSMSSLRTWLKSLTERKIVVRQNAGYVLAQGFRLPMVRVWSIEAKLTKWTRALYQATRYRAFSHRSVVMMPEANISAARDSISRFRSARVGLVGLTEDLDFRVHSLPRARMPRSQHLYTVARARIATQSSSV